MLGDGSRRSGGRPCRGDAGSRSSWRSARPAAPAKPLLTPDPHLPGGDQVERGRVDAGGACLALQIPTAVPPRVDEHHDCEISPGPPFLCFLCLPYTLLLPRKSLPPNLQITGSAPFHVAVCFGRPHHRSWSHGPCSRFCELLQSTPRAQEDLGVTGLWWYHVSMLTALPMHA
ncbi:uncharacterized protein [Triticum aestivum]|uniref:uncharacterized protein n=1 Tax=Triticum aestivum TaxID=4565 RepID=UPI001D00888A|nr:uncharacterized protein LOC123112688 [Triticum aestivum]